RTPQAREWVSAHDRGTSSTNQSVPCQSAEGLNMTVGVSIGVSVLEENSPIFLYRFGVYQDAKTKLDDPNEIFRSVHYGRSLSDITDSVVRRKVQTLVCSGISARPFDQANREL